MTNKIPPLVGYQAVAKASALRDRTFIASGNVCNNHTKPIANDPTFPDHIQKPSMVHHFGTSTKLKNMPG